MPPNQPAPGPASPARAEARTRAHQGHWWVVLVASGLGMAITILMVMQKVALLEGGRPLVWDISERVSCTTVLSSWQSSLLGPPNAVLGTAAFAILASAALGAVLGTRPSRAFLLALWGLAVGFATFATWFLFQSTFAIGSMCLWCAGIVTAVMATGAALTHLATGARVWGGGRAGSLMAGAAEHRIDVLAWAGWWAAVVAMVVLGLA